MKIKNLIFLLLTTIGISTSNFAQDFSFNWLKNIGNSLNTGSSHIEHDSSGNIYISGGFIGTLDFDPGVGVYNLTSQNNTYGDYYLLKLIQLIIQILLQEVLHMDIHLKLLKMEYL
jgi:hypothetical protein